MIASVPLRAGGQEKAQRTARAQRAALDEANVELQALHDEASDMAANVDDLEKKVETLEAAKADA